MARPICQIWNDDDPKNVCGQHALAIARLRCANGHEAYEPLCLDDIVQAVNGEIDCTICFTTSKAEIGQVVVVLEKLT